MASNKKSAASCPKRSAAGISPAPYTVKAKHLKYFWGDKKDPVRPTREQLKVIALNTPVHIDANKDNLYKVLQSKFPGKDVDNDPNERQRFEYYLHECGGYYAQKNRDRLRAVGDKNARSRRNVVDERWRTWRVAQMAALGVPVPEDDDGDDDDDEDAESQMSSVSDTQSDRIDDQDAQLMQESSGALPDSEQLIDTQLDMSSVVDADDDDDDDEEEVDVDDIEDELADDGSPIVLLVDSDPLVVAEELAEDTAPDTESQSQSLRESQMDVPYATSTQTQK